ncbi:SDR family NAD(P)-dependent oxidoreductase [Iodidimonas sp. SYSU 1G8]|uniref:SDR family NAD(P)-dependent oxidoreductase n=1 Tax=Iodidimonas sp. SYSU 1G8 TaxID=3133967 RepID=UPI0031FE4F04
MSLAGLGSGLRTVVIGASGGIGGALAAALEADPAVAAIHACSRAGSGEAGGKRGVHAVDVTDEDSIAAAAARIGAEGPLHLVVVATGMLHQDGQGPEKTYRQLDAAQMMRAFQVNTIGPALVAKHFVPLLDRSDPAIFAALSARVGSISDNRLGGWYSYRASKSALNMLIRTLSIELARTHKQAVCVGLHPGTVDTGLSRPFQRAAKQLLTPEESAAYLVDVLGALTPAASGSVLAWDGKMVPV